MIHILPTFAKLTEIPSKHGTEPPSSVLTHEDSPGVIVWCLTETESSCVHPGDFTALRPSCIWVRATWCVSGLMGDFRWVIHLTLTATKAWWWWWWFISEVIHDSCSFIQNCRWKNPSEITHTHTASLHPLPRGESSLSQSDYWAILRHTRLNGKLLILLFCTIFHVCHIFIISSVSCLLLLIRPLDMKCVFTSCVCNALCVATLISAPYP